MNVLHIAVLSNVDNPDLIKLLLHFGADHQVCCICKRVSIYTLSNIYDNQMSCTPYKLAEIKKKYQIKDILVST
jgi:hypothetical protein